jgi:hypothetical protein
MCDRGLSRGYRPRLHNEQSVLTESLIAIPFTAATTGADAELGAVLVLLLE